MTRRMFAYTLGCTGVGRQLNNLVGNPLHELDTFREGAVVTISGPPDKYIADGWVAGLQSSDPAAAVKACRATASPPLSLDGNLLLQVAGTTGALAAGDYLGLHHCIEGLELVDLNLGGPSADTLYLAFKARCSEAPYTFAAIFINAALNRAFPISFTVAVVGAWQQFTATIPGDTEGIWTVPSTGPGAYLRFGVTGGSNLVGTSGIWNSGTNVVVTPDCSNSLMQTLGATFEIADVALATQSTVSKRGSASDLFIRMQRYLTKSYDQGVPLGAATDNGAVSPGDVRYAVPQRIAGAVTLYSPHDGAPGMAYDYANGVNVPATVLRTGTRGFTWSALPASGNVVNIGAHFFSDARFGSLESALLT